MTNLRIEYWGDDAKFSAEVDVYNAMDAAAWMYINLKDWCVDEDITVYIDNIEVAGAALDVYGSPIGAIFKEE